MLGGRNPGSESQLSHELVSWLCVGHLTTLNPSFVLCFVFCEMTSVTMALYFIGLYRGPGEVGTGQAL